MKLRSTYKMMSTSCVQLNWHFNIAEASSNKSIPVIDNMSNLQIFLDQSLRQE